MPRHREASKRRHRAHGAKRRHRHHHKRKHTSSAALRESNNRGSSGSQFMDKDKLNAVLSQATRPQFHAQTGRSHPAHPTRPVPVMTGTGTFDARKHSAPPAGHAPVFSSKSYVPTAAAPATAPATAADDQENVPSEYREILQSCPAGSRVIEYKEYDSDAYAEELRRRDITDDSADAAWSHGVRHRPRARARPDMAVVIYAPASPAASPASPAASPAAPMAPMASPSPPPMALMASASPCTPAARLSVPPAARDGHSPHSGRRGRASMSPPLRSRMWRKMEQVMAEKQEADDAAAAAQRENELLRNRIARMEEIQAAREADAAAAAAAHEAKAQAEAVAADARAREAEAEAHRQASEAKADGIAASLAAARAEAADAAARAADLEQALADTKAQLLQQQQECGHAQAEVLILQSNIKALRRQLSVNERSNAEMSAERDAVMADLRQERAEHRSVVHDMERASQETIARLEATILGKNREVVDLRRRLLEAEAALRARSASPSTVASVSDNDETDGELEAEAEAEAAAVAEPASDDDDTAQFEAIERMVADEAAMGHVAAAAAAVAVAECASPVRVFEECASPVRVPVASHAVVHRHTPVFGAGSPAPDASFEMGESVPSKYRRLRVILHNREDFTTSSSDSESEDEMPADMEYLIEDCVRQLEARYQFLARIAVNDDNAVYKARDLATGELVAVKIIQDVPPHVESKEVTCLKAVQGHPCIQRLVHWQPLARQNCQVVVTAFVQEAKVDPNNRDDLRRYIYDVVSAIKYCHDQKIMNRDLKPANVIYDGSKATVIDFDCATSFASGRLPVARVGTDGFMAPEIDGSRKINNRRAYGPLVDVWSAGVAFGSVVFTGLLPRRLFYPDLARILEELRGTAMWGDEHDLLARMLELVPSRRITPEQILAHPFVRSLAGRWDAAKDAVAQQSTASQQPTASTTTAAHPTSHTASGNVRPASGNVRPASGNVRHHPRHPYARPHHRMQRY